MKALLIDELMGMTPSWAETIRIEATFLTYKMSYWERSSRARTRSQRVDVA